MPRQRDVTFGEPQHPTGPVEDEAVVPVVRRHPVEPRHRRTYVVVLARRKVGNGEERPDQGDEAHVAGLVRELEGGARDAVWPDRRR